MTNNYTYNFSYTGFSLRVKEMSKVARMIKDREEIDYAFDLGSGKEKTGKIFMDEIAKRLNSLTPAQTDILINGDLTSQKQIGFLSMCKCHLFIRDFTVEVLRENLLVFDNHLTEGEYISFFRRKSEIHHELEKLKDSSSKKIKQVTFRILEQAGIIDSVDSKIIQPQILDQEVIETIVADDPLWLKIFFISDMDIAKLAS